MLDSRGQSIEAIAHPILESAAFRRLASATFLGILSPKYSGRAAIPLKFSGAQDGSRYEHSTSVARIFILLADRLQLDQLSKRYGIAWALLHDIATWPLSHTGEAAFVPVTGVTSNRLRSMMITSDRRLPSNFGLSTALRDMGVVPEIVLSLFDKSRKPADKSLCNLWSLIHSPVTPDAIEGMWRTGRVFNIDVPSPSEIIDGIERSLLGPIVTRDGSKAILSFWRRKSDIYQYVINRERTIRVESTWSASISTYFADVTLGDSLVLEEDEIIRTVLDRGLVTVSTVQRYKNPLTYYLSNCHGDGVRVLKSDQPLDDLANILKKKKMRKDSRDEAGRKEVPRCATR